MTTGAQYVNIKSKRLMGTDDFGERMMEYMRTISHETNARTYDSSAFLVGTCQLAADGNDQFRLDKSLAGVIASDGAGHFLDPDRDKWNWFRHVYMQNALGVSYSVALHYCLIPAGVQINPRTGAPEYVAFEDQVGEVDLPSSVVDNGTNITFVVDSVLEVGVGCAGRRVWVYMVNPARGASTEAIAIEECVVVWDSGQNKITTTGLLGQTTVSTTAADYRVAALGPTVKRYTDLSVVPEYAFVGQVTGGGAGNPPTFFDITSQRVVPYSWVSALVDGLPQNLIPATDNAHDLGSPSRRWANIYTANLVVSSHLLPVLDDAQDLGSALLRWRDLHLSGTAILREVIPATDNAHDLGSGLVSWKDIYVNVLRLGTGGGMGVAGHLLPTVTGTYNLGSPTYRWQDAEVNFVKIAEWLELPTTAGKGVHTSMVPTTHNAFDLGATSYRWKDLFVAGAATVATATITKLSLGVGALEGVGSHMISQGHDELHLGSATNRWKELHVQDVYLDNAAGKGVASDLVPTTTATFGLGNASYTWAKLYLVDLSVSDAAGKGVETNLVPTVNASFTLGGASYGWLNGYFTNMVRFAFAEPTGGASGVCKGDWTPTVTATNDLGITGRRWKDLWASGTATISILALPGSSGGEGVGSHLVPTADDTYDLGRALYKWRNAYIDGTAYVDTLALSVTAGEGVSTDVLPSATNTHDLGSSAAYWAEVWCDTLYYKTQTSFDDYDDLALIEAYTPGEIVVEATKAGETRAVRLGDPCTIPWPMLDERHPDNEGAFIHAPDATMFLLGGIKQLYQLHKAQVASFQETIAALATRLEEIAASK